MSTQAKERDEQDHVPTIPERLAGLRDSIAHAIGVHIDVSRLSRDEAHELADLQKKLTRREGYEASPSPWFSFSRLTGQERDRWRLLVGRAAGDETLLDRRDEDTSFRKRCIELARRTRPIERSLFVEPGSVTLPKEVVFDWLERPDPVLELSHLGLLVAVLAMLENGQSVVRPGRVEGEGPDRMLLLRSGSLAKLDPEGHVTTYASKIFTHLARNGLVTFSEQAGERRIGYGPKTRPEEPATS